MIWGYCFTVLFFGCVGGLRQHFSAHERWAHAAVEAIHNTRCSENHFVNEKVCQKINSVHEEQFKSQVAVYVADPRQHGDLHVVLPDERLRAASNHKAVILLDPFPAASFGHSLVLFFLDFGVAQDNCTSGGGIPLALTSHEASGECLTPGVKNRCRNLVSRGRSSRRFVRRCEINFPPLVYHSDGSEAEGEPPRQELTCRNILGFAPCPILRSENDTAHLYCNPLRDNHRRCEVTQFTGQCRRMMKCDHALIISGGWRRDTSLPEHRDAVFGFFRFLRRSGYTRRNIKIFYANGAHSFDDEGEDVKVYPSAVKAGFRNHLTHICEARHCSETVLLYLNGPALYDGTTLLWDADGNGMMDASEKYTLAELLADLEGCRANNVIIVADHSYSGQVARAFENSINHNNVRVFASSGTEEASWEHEFTNRWMRQDHLKACASTAFKHVSKHMSTSTPAMRFYLPDNLRNHSPHRYRAIDTTVFGAPCDHTRFPLSDRELRRKYMGCQSIPTAVWMMPFSEDAEEND